jgi:Oxidoreductase-like protein, N-terminal
MPPANRSTFRPNGRETMSDPANAGDPAPEPPRAPEPDDCCQSGCERCVYDVYLSEVERYETALAAWKQRHGSA